MEQWGQQSSETTNPSKLTNTLLNGRNYLSWAMSARLALSARDKLEFITGEKTKPEPKDPEKPTDAEKQAIRKWQTTDHTVMTWLIGSMESKISDLFLYSCASAEELWEGVRTFYGQQKNHSHVYRLKQEIQQQKQENQPHIEYLGNLKRKFDELRIYRPITTDLKELQRRQEEDEIFQYLSGLDSSFETVRAQIVRGPELPSFSEVVSMIQREDSMRLAMGGPQVRNEGHETQGFAVKNPSFQNPNPQNRPKSRDPAERCAHCKKEGHTEERCWFLHPNLKPKWWKEEKGGRGSHANEERRKGEKGKGGAPSGFVTQNRPNPLDSTETNSKAGGSNGSAAGGSTGSGDQMQHILQQLTALLALQNTSSCGIASHSNKFNLFDQIIIDSGATDHMFGNKQFLTNLDFTKNKQYVLVANGMKTQINGVGEINLGNKIIDNI